MSLKWNAVPVVLLCCASAAYAEDKRPVTWELGSEWYRENYQEKFNGASYMKEEADMLGVHAGMRVPFNMRHAMTASARYASGSSEYTGAYGGMPYGSLVVNGQDRYAFDVRTAYEITLPYVTPSAGLGYRRLVDRLDQVGEGAYRRTSHYWYLTAGIASTLPLGQSGWQVTPQVTYQYLLRGKQQSGEVITHQHTGGGLELSAALRAPLSRTMNMVLTPYFRYWHIGNSETVRLPDRGHLMEPDNTTHEVGVRLSLAL